MTCEPNTEARKQTDLRSHLQAGSLHRGVTKGGTWVYALLGTAGI